MQAHKISSYKDGLVWVRFCTVCGEDVDLSGSCSGRYIDKNEKVVENKVDKDKEPE